jgi:GT2 family glycosyltransferase
MGEKEYGVQWVRLFSALSPEHIKKGIRYLKRHGVKQFFVRLFERFQSQDIDYEKWFALNRATPQKLERQRNVAFAHPAVISIVVPLYQTPERFLREMIESVCAQTYGGWELCLADASPLLAEQKDGEAATALTAIVREYQKKEPRIRYRILEKNAGISENTNEAMQMASGDFIGFLDHDDLLEPDALYEVMAQIDADEQVDVIYTDEDKINRAGTKHLIPNMKPDFNPDLLRSNNYICHFLVVRKTVIDQVGGFRKEFDGAQDHDFIFRCTETARRIAHVPHVLYHWRIHSGSTSDNPDSKLYAFDAGKRAVEAHLARLGVDAAVEETTDLGYYRVRYALKEHPMVSVIIPNKDEKESLQKCLKSILEKTEYDNYEILIVENNSTKDETFAYYKEIDGKNGIRVLYWDSAFNYSAINNFAAREAKGEYLLLLNNDTEVITKGWMKEMLSNCQRSEVGMVGAKLYFPDDTIQHAGVIIGLGGLADHAFVNMSRRRAGYMHRASIQMNLSAVTAACAMVKRSVYEEVGGLEEELTVAFNDVDLCLKIVTAGYRIVYDPYVELYHYESRSRGVDDEKNERHKNEVKYAQEKWKDFLNAGDPCYNRNLTLSKHNFSLRK